MVADHFEVVADRFEVVADHFQVVADHFQVVADHFQVVADHFEVVTDHFQVVTDHFQVVTDHFEVVTDHFQVVTDHFQVVTDHFQVVTDHFEVVADHFEVVADRFGYARPMTFTKRAALILLSVAMVGVGIDHFVNPSPFERIVPDYLPAPHALVLISGAFECLGGIGVLVPRTRRFAAWGLVALYVAVFPANVNMAIHQIQLEPGGTLPVWAMWLRLPFQALFIAYAFWFTRDDDDRLSGSASAPSSSPPA